MQTGDFTGVLHMFKALFGGQVTEEEQRRKEKKSERRGADVFYLGRVGSQVGRPNEVIGIKNKSLRHQMYNLLIVRTHLRKVTAWKQVMKIV